VRTTPTRAVACCPSGATREVDVLKPDVELEKVAEQLKASLVKHNQGVLED
jgi:hypothetical protein